MTGCYCVYNGPEGLRRAAETAHLHVNASNPPAVLLSHKGVQIVATIPVNGHRLVFPQDWVIAPGSRKLLATVDL